MPVLILILWRTRCETEDEEEVILAEIEKMFPTDVDTDFGEFIQSDSLEKIVKKSIPKEASKSSDILSPEDMKLLCTSFINIMQNFSRFVCKACKLIHVQYLLMSLDSFELLRCYYYNSKMNSNTPTTHLDFITPYETNSSVFNQLLKKYKSCLNTKMDETFYGGLGLIIGISQQNYDFLQISGLYRVNPC